MVFLVQLCIFLGALFYRRGFLLGNHLQQSSYEPRWLTYTNQYKSMIVARHIGVIQEFGFPFIITREKWYHRILKSLGIASEISVGENGFDRKHFLITDYPTHLEKILKSENIVSKITEIFSFPVDSFHATRNKMWIIIQRKDFNKADEYYHNQLSALSWISKLVQEVNRDTKTSFENKKTGAYALAFLATHAGMVLLGILGALPTNFDSIA
jgi:hypothetical protein